MRKLLIVKLSAIGDVVLSLPAFETIRDENPGAHITLLIGQASAPLVQGHPAIDKVWVIDEMIFWQKRIVSLIRLALALRKERFDAVFILHWSTLFHRYFQWIGIPERWGFNRDATSTVLTHSVPYVEGDPHAHDVSQYLAAVSKHYRSTQPPARTPKLYLSEEEKRAASQVIASSPVPIAVAPGGGHNPKLFMPQKRWHTKNFYEIAKRLIEQDNATLFLLGDASEATLLQDLAEEHPERVTLLAGKATLRETAAVIAKCKLFIGNDSGLFHIAGATGTPSISFFGPTSPNGKQPVWLKHSILYSQESCSPCYKHGYAPPCPYELKCMTNISVAQAYEAAQHLLRTTS